MVKTLKVFFLRGTDPCVFFEWRKFWRTWPCIIEEKKYWKKIAQMKLFCVYMQMQLMKLYENSSSLYERVGNYISRQSRKRASRLFVHLTVLKELPRVLFRGLENPRHDHPFFL